MAKSEARCTWTEVYPYVIVLMFCGECKLNKLYGNKIFDKYRKLHLINKMEYQSENGVSLFVFEQQDAIITLQDLKKPTSSVFTDDIWYSLLISRKLWYQVIKQTVWLPDMISIYAALKIELGLFTKELETHYFFCTCFHICDVWCVKWGHTTVCKSSWNC